MRNALAVAAGVLVGLLLPALTMHIVHAVVTSGGATLAWEVGLPLSTFGLGSRGLSVAAALIGVLGVPALLAAVAEASCAGRGPRRAGTIVLAGVAIVGLGATAVPIGPFFVAALLGAVLLALAPGRWASVPIAVALGVVTWAWWHQLVGSREFLTPAASTLSHSFGASVGAWTLALAWVSGGLLLTGVFGLLRRPGSTL